MRISTRADYAVDAASAMRRSRRGSRWRRLIAMDKEIPHRFLEEIFTGLRRAGLIASRRGARGGHRAARDARGITVGDIIRAVKGPLPDVADASASHVRREREDRWGGAGPPKTHHVLR